MTKSRREYEEVPVVGLRGECRLMGDGVDLVIIYKGQRIALRGYTSQRRTWVVLVPGFTVTGRVGHGLAIRFDSSAAQPPH